MPNSLGETKPRWWPNDIMFDDDILLRTSNRGVSNNNLLSLYLRENKMLFAIICREMIAILSFQTWSRNLRKIITAVYNHYESQFLLDFSKRLMVCFSQDMVDIKENENGTRSMVSQNKKLLVTFKSENMVRHKLFFTINTSDHTIFILTVLILYVTLNIFKHILGL